MLKSLQRFCVLVLFLSFSSLLFPQLQQGKATIFASDSVKTRLFTPSKARLTDSIINYGKIFLNSRYRRGGNGSTNSFDCSGFTSFVYQNFGYNLKHSSAEQAEQIDVVDRSNLKKGDLVFFSGRRVGKRVGHVGIVVSADQSGKFNFIHASSQNGVIISNSDEPYYLRRYLKAGRVVYDNRMLPIAPQLSGNKITITPESDSYSGVVAGKVTQTQKIIPAKYHKIKKGETLSSIAKKYGLSIAELKQKNKIKDSKITPGKKLKIKDSETVLLVQAIQPLTENNIESDDQPNDSLITKQEIPQNQLSHIVKKGETLFSISNLYHLSVDQLKNFNRKLSSGFIHIGQKLKIISAENKVPTTELAKTEEPVKVQDVPKAETETKPEVIPKKSPTKHKVVRGESLISIAKQYNISVDGLKKLNNLTGNKIKAGQVIFVATTESMASTHTKATSTEGSITKAEKKTKKFIHKVKQGESYYSVARVYGCNVEDLKRWNKKTGNKIKSGEKIIIYSKND